MNTLLEIRDRIISVYRQYTSIFTVACRFLAVMLALLYINNRIGYQKTLASPLLSAIIALVCTMIPSGTVVAILAIIVIVQLYSLSLEAAVVGAVLFLLMYLVYFRFHIRDSILFVLAPAFSLIGIPYVLPVAGGLLSTAGSGITCGLGMVMVYFINFVSENAAAIGSTQQDDGEALTRFRFLVDGIVQNQAMIVMLISMIAAAALVYVIRRLMIRYSWYIASVAGALVQLIILLVGDMLFATNMNIAGAFLGCLAAALIGLGITFFAFNLDYSRVENTQFEDDDYYYYVKAVPKNTYSAPRRTVKQINTSRRVPRQDDDSYEYQYQEEMSAARQDANRN